MLINVMLIKKMHICDRPYNVVSKPTRQTLKTNNKKHFWLFISIIECVGNFPFYNLPVTILFESFFKGFQRFLLVLFISKIKLELIVRKMSVGYLAC